jgi:hypothetical protein
MSSRFLFAAAALLTVGASVATTSAAPSNTAITAVYQASRCASGPCGPGDANLSSGAVTSGMVQVDVTSDSNLGLQSVQLQAIGGGEATYQCVRLWNAAGAKHFIAGAMWDTNAWSRPGSFSGCTEAVTHKHGEPTPNGSYSLRVVARESGSNQEQISSDFVLRLSNPADAPLWRGKPTTSGGAVTLRWYRNPEPDVVEYRITRTDARGSRIIAVDAAAPTHTAGCPAEQEATFTCIDTPAPGTVRYTVRAYRPTPANAPACKTRPGPCVASAAAAQQTVTVGRADGPTPKATTPAPTVPANGITPGAGTPATLAPKPTDTAPAAPGNTESGTTPSAAAATGDAERGVPIALAVAALAGLMLAHAGLRRSTRNGSA